MRIAIFDGILETHVGDSLERAFRRRGHQVLNTGKVGSGFEFPLPGTDLGHLEHAVSQVLDHRPDWVIVMRPASLPPMLLARLRASGAGLAVWLSDDPVLLHLSYAPIIDSYDLVLHCGTADVLGHYEELFGRPTGVNFPFWTDHEAFPKVWGKERAESTALFLGNVHDHVRRKRYFALGSMRTDVRIHGNVGTDYLNLSGGYLDSDAEVVNAGARARVALNIPQFFADHRGLPTWFPGLDRLGFFEYPSRVIQYLAMGLPVVSIIPGRPRFESLPEMLVVEDVAEADQTVARLVDGDIGALSDASEQRFARNFSADARVLAFEALVGDDSWRGLDPLERNLWFTQFDGSAVGEAGVTTRSRESVSITETPGPGRVLVIGRETDRPTSRPAVTARALLRLGAEVDLVDVAAGPVPEDEAIAGVVVCGVESVNSLPALPEGAWSVLVDETSRDVRTVLPWLSRFDAVGVRDAGLHSRLAAAGHSRFVACPPAVDQDYLEQVAAVPEVAAVVHTHASPETDNKFAPALNTDLVGGDIRRQRYSELWGLDLPELAARCRGRVGLVGFVGAPTDPVIDEITPFAAAAADVLVVARVTPAARIAPYPDLGLQVREPGELAIKLRRLADSPMMRETAASSGLESVLGAEAVFERLLAAAVANRVSGRGIFPQGTTPHALESDAVEVQAGQGEIQTVLNLRVSTSLGSPRDYVVQVLEAGEPIHEATAQPSMGFVVAAAQGRRLGPLAVRLRYEGPASIHPSERIAAVEVSSEPLTSIVTARGTNARATTVWRRV